MARKGVLNAENLAWSLNGKVGVLRTEGSSHDTLYTGPRRARHPCTTVASLLTARRIS